MACYKFLDSVFHLLEAQTHTWDVIANQEKMTEKEIKQSIEMMSIHLTKSKKFRHWFNFFFLLFPVCLMGYTTIEKAVQNEEFSLFPLTLIGFFIFFLRHKLISPKLKKYKSNITEEQFKQANQAAAKLNNWTICQIRKIIFQRLGTLVGNGKE